MIVLKAKPLRAELLLRSVLQHIRKIEIVNASDGHPFYVDQVEKSA